MNKRLLLSFVVASLIFTACKKKSSSEEEQPDPFKLEYANLSTEEHKKQIEKAGVEFIAKLNELPDQKCIDVLQYLSGLNPEVGDSGLFDRIISMSTSSGSSDFNYMFKNMASTSEVSSVEGLNDFYGVYTWNQSKHDWDKTVSSNRLEIRFPSNDTKVVNNATLSLSYMASAASLADVSTSELPASVNAVLKVDNNEELRLASNYSYNADGTPSKVNMVLTLGAFSFKYKIVNDGKEASTEWAFLKGEEALMGVQLSAAGAMKFDSNTADQDIVKNANASFEIMNIKMLGQADLQGLLSDTSANNLSDSLSAVKQADLFNKHIKFIAINKTTNSIIAKTFFVSSSDNGHNSVEPLLVFRDDSRMNIDEFFKDGFEALTDSLNDFANQF